MNLSQLKTFRTVARLNSFSRAAVEMHLTQPAVSAQVTALENALKVRLFDRVGRKISLTPQGHVVLACAEDLHQRVEQMRMELDDIASVRGGRLNLGASLLLGVYLLPDILARFKEQHPSVDFSVRIDPARQILDLVERNELDVAIIGEGVPVDHDRLATRPVLRDELIVIVPPGHELADHPVVTVPELKQQPCILPARDSASGESMHEQLRNAGIDLHSVLELGNVGAVKRAVEAGLGISIVSRFAVMHELQEGRLCSLHLAGVTLERHFSLVWHHGKPFSKITAAFIRFVQAYMHALEVQVSAEDKAELTAGEVLREIKNEIEKAAD